MLKNIQVSDRKYQQWECGMFFGVFPGETDTWGEYKNLSHQAKIIYKDEKREWVSIIQFPFPTICHYGLMSVTLPK